MYMCVFHSHMHGMHASTLAYWQQYCVVNPAWSKSSPFQHLLKLEKFVRKEYHSNVVSRYMIILWIKLENRIRLILVDIKKHHDTMVFFCAQKRTRTSTTVASHKALNLARLPVPPPERVVFIIPENMYLCKQMSDLKLSPPTYDNIESFFCQTNLYFLLFCLPSICLNGKRCVRNHKHFFKGKNTRLFKLLLFEE